MTSFCLSPTDDAGYFTRVYRACNTVDVLSMAPRQLQLRGISGSILLFL